MKKGFSILFVVIVLITGVHFTIASHYCKGKVISTKISFSGHLATCGMEEAEREVPQGENLLNSHCCDDEVTAFAVDNSFTPAVKVLFEEFKFPVRNIESGNNLDFDRYLVHSTFYYDTGPPGSLKASSVRLDYICVFRI